MIAIRVLRDIVGKNVVQSHLLYPGEEFLAQELTRFEYRVWEPHFGRELPAGAKAIVVFANGDRLTKGEVVVVGTEGVDWEVVGTAPLR